MRDVALTLVIAGLLPLCIMRPWIGVLVWYWVGMMNPHKLTFGFAQGIPFAMLVGASLLLGTLLARERKPIEWSREMILLFVLFTYFTATSILAWAPDEAWRQWDKVMKIVLVTYIATMFIYGKQRIWALLMVLTLSVGYYGVKGGVWAVATGGGHQVQGPESTFLSGNTFLGAALVMVWPLMIALAREEHRKLLKRFLYFCVGSTFVAIIFTYSRGALLGLAAVVPLLFLRGRKKFLLLLLIVPLAIFGKDLLPEKLVGRAKTIETYEEDGSSMQRIRAWSVAFGIARDFPLNGAGFEFEYYPDAGRWHSYVPPELRVYGDKTHSAHSVYFQILGNHGFVAFFLYLMLIGWTLITLGRLRRDSEKLPAARWIAPYASALQIAVVGFAVAGAFLSLAYSDLFYVYVAITAILGREIRIAKTEAAKSQQAAIGIGSRGLRAAGMSVSQAPRGNWAR